MSETSLLKGPPQQWIRPARITAQPMGGGRMGSGAMTFHEHGEREGWADMSLMVAIFHFSKERHLESKGVERDWKPG